MIGFALGAGFIVAVALAVVFVSALIEGWRNPMVRADREREAVRKALR